MLCLVTVLAWIHTQDDDNMPKMPKKPTKRREGRKEDCSESRFQSRSSRMLSLVGVTLVAAFCVNWKEDLTHTLMPLIEFADTRNLSMRQVFSTTVLPMTEDDPTEVRFNITHVEWNQYTILSMMDTGPRLECPSTTAKNWNFLPLLDEIPHYVSTIFLDMANNNNSCLDDKGTPTPTTKGYPNNSLPGDLQQFLKGYFPLSEIRLWNENDASSVAVTYKNTTKNSIKTVRSGTHEDPQEQHDCANIRGRLGTWKYDKTYANRSHYKTKWILSEQYLSGPYNHSSYVWNDAEPSCDIQEMNLPGLCQALTSLNMTRILVLGDSMEFMRLKSFYNLLGLPDTTDHHLRPRFQMRHEHVLSCPNNDNTNDNSPTNIPIIFYRVNHLQPLLAENYTADPSLPLPEIRRLQATERWAREFQGDKKVWEYFVCYGVRQAVYPDEDGHCPWVKEYLASQGKTMLISAVGPHFHHLSAFREMMDRFMTLFRQHPRPQDLVWFRTVSPGHVGCGDLISPTAPLSSLGSFQKLYAHATQYDWDQFIQYNQHMEAQVLKAQDDPTWKGPSMDLLDIYWTMALRHDGHPSSIDCMHYLLPGPPDWWNHLFYSNLVDLAGKLAS